MQKKGNMKKVVKSKAMAQKWLWWSDNGKVFNSNNSGKFVLPPLTENWHKNSLELLLLKFCHYQTTSATSGLPLLISQLFSCCLFKPGARPVGWLRARLVVLRKVCVYVCMYVCIFVCLSAPT